MLYFRLAIRALSLTMVVACGGCSTANESNSAPHAEPNSIQSAKPGELVDFLTAEISAGANGAPELRVSGRQPGPNVRVKLSPVTYIVQPDYWRIEVRAVSPPAGSATDLPADFIATLMLDGSVGKQGIEVAGATVTRRLDVARP